ncbi:MAG TPA: Tex-like N-terminal domain-containing protein, partial [Bacteroidales bacterium]|nr:Tex-like N-terminal domain-containing protein [Bacteroidales bacterium]
MINEKYAGIIAGELSVNPGFILNVINLLEGGATVPFIARYRKEMTGSMDEVAIMHVRERLTRLKELDARRETILNSLREQEKLTPELEAAVLGAGTMSELEDIYLPYRPKRKTRASIAREKGLEPLATLILTQHYDDIEVRARKFVDTEKGVNSVEEAIKGAADIIAETVNEDARARMRIRNLFQRESELTAKVVKGKEQEGINFKMYFDYHEPFHRAPSHRVLAMLRGENEGFLRISIDVNEEVATDILNRMFVRGNNASSAIVRDAIADSCKRLLFPSMETEVRQVAKEKADREAIRVFVENMRQLLMAPPLGQKAVLAIDPGFRTGCKVVCLDRQGKLVHNETIYPHPPQNEVRESIHKIKSLVSAYRIEAIAIG